MRLQPIYKIVLSIALLLLTFLVYAAIRSETRDAMAALDPDTRRTSVVSRELPRADRVSYRLANGLGEATVAGPAGTLLSSFAAPAATTTGQTGSLALDGTGDYVEVPHSDALNLGQSGAFTIEAWIRRANTDFCHIILGKDFTTAYSVDVCPSKLRLWRAGSVTAAKTDIPANVWTHIAIAWEQNGAVRFYINGQLDWIEGAGAAPGPSTRPLRIGFGYPPSLTDLWPLAGNLAEVRLWEVARSADDIRRTMHLALDEPLPGLVANWHLSADYRDNIGGHDGSAQGNANLNGPQAPPRPAVVPVDGQFNTLPHTRSSAATAFVPALNRAILAGGYRDAAFSGQIESIELSTGAAAGLGTLPVALTDAAAAYAPAQGTVYVFGGATVTANWTAAIYAIDVRLGAVRVLDAKLPQASSSAAAVYHPGLNKIVVLGGWTSGGASKSVSLFDPATETIQALSNLALPSPRYRMGAAYGSATGAIYYFGGLDGGNSFSAGIYEMLVDAVGNGEVHQVPSAALPIADDALTAVEDPATGLIYLVGGTYSKRVLTFDPVSAQLWQTAIQLDEIRSYASTVFSPRDRQALVIGGRDADGLFQKTIWRIPLGDGPAIPLGQWAFPQAATSEVTAIDGDEDKVLVATAEDGLWSYDEEGQRVQYNAAALGSTTGLVNDVRYSAANDQIWVATEDAGGLLIDGGVTTTYSSGALGTNQVLSVDTVPGYTDAVGASFFGTADQGLKHQVTLISPPGAYFWDTYFSGRRIPALAHRKSGDLWVIADGRLRQLSYAGSPVETDYGDRQCGLTGPDDMAFGLNGDWWIVSTEPGAEAGELTQPGICHLAAATVPPTGVARLSDPLIGNQASAVDVDADGKVWVAVKSAPGKPGGLVAYQLVGSSASVRTGEIDWLNGPVASYPLTLTANNSTTWASGFTALGAADERIWAGKVDGQLVTFAPHWQQLLERHGMRERQVEGVWLARGRAFFAAANSLHILSPDGRDMEDREIAGVRAVLGDTRGRIWVGSDSGVRLYVPGGWDPLSDRAGTPPAGPANALAEDNMNRIWIGGDGGLTLFDRNRFVTTFTTSNSALPHDSVRALLADRDGRLWVGTANGLAMLDGATWTVFSTADGLPDNAVYDLAQASDGSLAVSTGGGLALYDGSTFTPQNLPVAATNLPLTVDDEGRLWAGRTVRTATGWQTYYWANSGLRSNTVSDVAADGAGRVWFAHAPSTGVSVRGTLLPPLPDTLPTVSSISPNHGGSGDLIAINGSGFGSTAKDVQVTIGDAAATVVSATDSRLSVRLTDDNTSGSVSVRVGARRVLFKGSGRPAFCAEPTITTFTPTGGNDGVHINIFGKNLDVLGTIKLGDNGRTRTDFGWLSATRLHTVIQPGDGVGSIQFTGWCPGGTAYADSSSDAFRRIPLSVERVALNQGLTAYGLTANRETMIQYYVSHDVVPWPTDVVQVDQVEVTFSNSANESVTYKKPFNGTFTTSSGAPPAAWLRSLSPSINVVVKPMVGKTYWTDGLFSSDSGQLTMHSVLRNNGYKVGERTQTVRFRQERVLTVLLVPVMDPGYSQNDLQRIKDFVNWRLDELKTRIMPTGRVAFRWANGVCTDDDVSIGNYIDLYDASHCLDRQRRWYNKTYNPGMTVAFGVVQPGIAADTTPGLAFWPNMTDIADKLALDWIDTICDVGNAVVKVLSLGFLGSDDGCHLEIPLYVGWALGGNTSQNISGRTSALYGHELGHIMNLVQTWAPNGDLHDNPSHSINDELDGGSCYDTGVQWNWDLSLYRQPGVREPVVDPLTGNQLLPQQDNDRNTARGKAIMSYACTRNDGNVFFEPVDLLQSSGTYAWSSLLWTIPLLVGAGPSTASSAPAAIAEQPTPRQVPGERIYVSGTIDKAAQTGEVVHVEALGPDAPLDASYVTGYWLVQLDETGQELGRTGIFPVFTTEDHLDLDVGFFAATLLRREGLTTLELRSGEQVLDSHAAGGGIPSVQISSPTGGTYSDGGISLAWTASDPDGDALTIAVLYSADDGATWRPIAFDADSGTLNVPVSQLPGSDRARFQVLASDGFHSGSAISAPFAVSAKAPRPYIGLPAEDSSHLEGATLLLSGGAYDLQDEEVAPANLFWQSDRMGFLGGGEQIDALLDVGTHVLTLEAVNSLGLSAVATRTVTITGDYDRDGIGDDEEALAGLNPLSPADAYSDADGDDLLLVDERQRGTDPNNPDSDGDGRSDGDEVADGTNPGGSDGALPPDQLAASPAALSFSADLSQDVPMPQHQLHVSTRSPVTWTLAADVPWLSASAATGTTPDAPTIVARAFELEEGVHTATLTVTSAALGDELLVPVAVTVTNSTAFYDANQDGWLDVGDVQSVAARVPSDNSQEGFSHRYDVDRDGDVDGEDTSHMAERWMVDGRCCDPGSPGSSAVMRVVAPPTATVGVQITVTLHIEGPADLGGFEGMLRFDPDVLVPVDVQVGDLLGSTGRDAAMLGPVGAPDGAGLRFGAYSTGSASGPSSDGVLARVVFQAIGAGRSSLSLEQVLLADTAGAPSVPTLEGGEVEVTEGGSADQFKVFIPSIMR